MTKLSIVLPVYNEKDNIIDLINTVEKSIRKSIHTYEIIIVDDNSPDKTGKICKEYFLLSKKIKVFIRMKEKGFASAILYGIKKSKGELIVVMDTDFSHDPRLIPRMITKLKTSDIVIGSRYMQHGGGENKIRYLLSKVYNTYLRYLLKIYISDFLFGYFCTRRSFLLKNGLLRKDIFIGFGDYFIRLAYFINKSGGIFSEIPAYYKNRIYGESKSSLLKMLFTYTLTSIQIFSSKFSPENKNAK